MLRKSSRLEVERLEDRLVPTVHPLFSVSASGKGNLTPIAGQPNEYSVIANANSNWPSLEGDDGTTPGANGVKTLDGHLTLIGPYGRLTVTITTGAETAGRHSPRSCTSPRPPRYGLRLAERYGDARRWVLVQPQRHAVGSPLL